MAKSENFIHIRFEYSDALKTKRDVLSTQIDLAKIKENLRNYIALRNKELLLKEDLRKKLISVKRNISTLNKELPKVKIPKLLEKPLIETETREQSIQKLKTTPKKQIPTKETDELETQLQEIKSRIKALE